MAGKNNAKPAKQTEPAVDAAMAETIGGAAEQDVTPPMPEGESQNGAAPDEDQNQPGGPPEDSQDGQTEEQAPDMALHANGKTITDGGIFEHPAPAEGSGLYELEPVCTIGPEDMEQFSVAVFEAVASLIAGAGFLVRQGGEQTAPFGKDILAASFRQDGSITAATTDGRKFILKNGEVNEA